MPDITGTITLNTVTLPATADSVYLLADDDIPADGTLTYEATLDGATWETVTTGEITALAHTGTTFGLRASFALDDTSDNEVVVRWFIGYAS